MIAYIKGSLEEISEGNAVVEVGGIGYNVRISAGTVSQLPELHQNVKLYTYTYVREDTFCLYGFLTRDELHIFKLLITVNGVGPKGALGILSVMSAQELRFAVISADSKMIAKAPGIGKKTAERVILDLRDKVSFDDPSEDSALAETKVLSASAQSARNEAAEALVALGYSPSDALRAVKQVTDVPEDDTEAILKAALKNIF